MVVMLINRVWKCNIDSCRTFLTKCRCASRPIKISDIPSVTLCREDVSLMRRLWCPANFRRASQTNSDPREIPRTPHVKSQFAIPIPFPNNLSARSSSIPNRFRASIPSAPHVQSQLTIPRSVPVPINHSAKSSRNKQLGRLDSKLIIRPDTDSNIL